MTHLAKHKQRQKQRNGLTEIGERKVTKQSVVAGCGLRLNCRGEVKQRVQGWSQESLAGTAASHDSLFDLNRMVGLVTLSKKRKESRGDG